jgi:hypothetical protein
MATCPRCENAIAPEDPVCPFCDFDFPLKRIERSIQQTNLAYSIQAEIALLAGSAVVGFGCLWLIYEFVQYIFQGEFDFGLLYMPVCGFLGVALLLRLFRLKER